MAIALGTSAAHPLYLYIVFVVCVLAAVALLISGWVSHRRSSWPRYWQTQSAHPQSAPRTDAQGGVGGLPGRAEHPDDGRRSRRDGISAGEEDSTSQDVAAVDLVKLPP